MIGDAEQYDQLCRVYADCADNELIALSHDLDALTQTAQVVLQEELSRRRLSIPSKQAVSKAEAAIIKDSPLDRFASLAPPECVWEFPEAEDALAASEMLLAEGIRCDVIIPSSERFDRGAPRVAVLPEDVAKAREILSRPIPEEFRILVRTRDEFVVPVCPRCGAVDPLLESIEPTNHWRCEACGRTWSDGPQAD